MHPPVLPRVSVFPLEPVGVLERILKDLLDLAGVGGLVITLVIYIQEGGSRRKVLEARCKVRSAQPGAHRELEEEVLPTLGTDRDPGGGFKADILVELKGKAEGNRCGTGGVPPIEEKAVTIERIGRGTLIIIYPEVHPLVGAHRNGEVLQRRIRAPGKEIHAEGTVEMDRCGTLVVKLALIAVAEFGRGR